MTNAVKDDNSFKSIKIMNSSAKDFLRDRTHNEKSLTCTNKHIPKVVSTPDDGRQYFCKILNRTSYHKHERQHKTIQKDVASKDNDKHENENTLITGVHLISLLLGKVKIGNSHSIQHDYLIE